MFNYKKFHKYWQVVEISVLCILILTVWILLSLPVIFYHLPLNNVSFRLFIDVYYSETIDFEIYGALSGRNVCWKSKVIAVQADKL